MRFLIVLAFFLRDLLYLKELWRSSESSQGKYVKQRSRFQNSGLCNIPKSYEYHYPKSFFTESEILSGARFPVPFKISIMNKKMTLWVMVLQYNSALWAENPTELRPEPNFLLKAEITDSTVSHLLQIFFLNKIMPFFLWSVWVRGRFLPG